MATPWFRVWTDMVNDPKWRTIARISKQSIGDVIAVYLHMLTCSANATERGRTQGFSDEDVATALNIETAQVASIVAAMQGRVIDGDRLTGWEKRQPTREDNSAERGRAYREKMRLEKELEEAKKRIEELGRRTQPNAGERKGTELTLDTDTDTDIKEAAPPDSGESALDFQTLIFTQGVEILKRHGSAESTARSFLGQYAKDEEKLAGIIGQLMAKPKIEPKAYIAAAMKPKTRALVL